MNSVYDGARYRFATKALDWRTENLVLIAWAGTPNFVPADTLVSAIVTRGVTTAIGHSMAIATRTVTPDGYMQTDAVLIPAVPIGAQLTHFIMANMTTNWNDGQPLLYTDEAVELPFDPNGLDILVTPDWLAKRGWGRV